MKAGSSAPRIIFLFTNLGDTLLGRGALVLLFWHYSRGPSTIFSMADDKDRFISPALFADGHTKEHDFSRAITSRPSFPCEPTQDWYFYEPQQ